MTKEQFIDERTKIISKMLDNPNSIGIYEAFTQDSEHEFECPNCEQTFYATI